MVLVLCAVHLLGCAESFVAAVDVAADRRRRKKTTDKLANNMPISKTLLQ
jgi:hypothetical protein